MLMLPGDVFQFTLSWGSLENFEGKYKTYEFQISDVIIIIKTSVFEFAKSFNQHVLFMCNGKYHQIEFFTPDSVKLEHFLRNTIKLNNNDKL